MVAGCGQARAELTPAMDGGQPGLALSHTNSSSEAPPQKATENKDQGAKVVYLDFFFTKEKIFFKLQKKTIIYLLEFSHSGNEP